MSLAKARAALGGWSRPKQNQDEEYVDSKNPTKSALKKTAMLTACLLGGFSLLFGLGGGYGDWFGAHKIITIPVSSASFLAIGGIVV